MILMWLGSFVLMMFGLSESQKAASAFFAKTQKAFLEKGFGSSTVQIFLRSCSVVFLEASPQRSLYTGLALYNLRVLSLRPSVLQMCLNILGAWWVLILGLLFLSFNGFFPLGLCALGLIGVWRAPRAQILLKWVFSLGVFLVGGETLLRNSSVLQTLLGQSELAFFLVDGRFGAVLSLLAASIFISFIIQIEFWSLVLALSLLATSTISFNGALALVAGERIARMLLFWWRSRSLNQECQRVGGQLSAVSIVGVVLGFLLAGEMRSYFYWGFSTDLSSFQDKSLQLVILFAVILAVQGGAQMIWGHFGSQVQVEELQDAKYFSPSWKEFELLSMPAMAWAHEKVHKRLSEIRYHLHGLGSLKEGQVPDHIQARLKEEERQLSLLDQSLKA